MADQNPIQALFDTARRQDAAMNTQQIAPTADSYEVLFNLVQAAEQRLLADAQALPYRVKIRWGVEALDEDVKTHSFVSAAERRAFMAGVDAADGWMAYQVESEEA